jgi:hypothetical protein
MRAKRLGGVGGILLVLCSILNVGVTVGYDLVTEIGQKIECHLVQMLENQLQAGVVDEAGGELGGDGEAALGDEPHTPETTSRESSSSKQSQSCSKQSSEWQVLSQWCQVVTRSDACTPTGLASAICEKATLCTAAVDAVKNTSDTVKAAALAPFQRAWAAIRGRSVPFSPDSAADATDEADATAELNADVPYGTELDLSDPEEAGSLETAADSGGGEPGQAAGDTTDGLEAGLSSADESFAGATSAADGEGLNGDDGPGAAAGDMDKAAADAVEAGAETASKVGLKVVAKVGLKVLGWVALAWSVFDFLGELTANYTTSDQIQQAGWHYYGLLDIVPPSDKLLISQDALNKNPGLASEFGSKLLTCQNLIDLQAQVLGDPTSVANQEIVGSFLDPTAATIEVGPFVPESSSTHAWGHVDQDKNIHDPVLNLIPVGSKTFDSNIGEILDELVPNSETGRPNGTCDLGVPGATQPQTPNWAQVIKGAITQDEQLAGVISTEQAGYPSQVDPWGVPDGAAFTNWTVNDILTFGLGADPLAHYYKGDDLLGQDESLANGRCISAMALTPYGGMVPEAYSELLSQVRQGNFTAFDLLDQAATQLSSDDNPTTGDCLFTPLDPVPGSSSCITDGTDIVNQAAADGVSPYQSCLPTPLWRTTLPVYSPGYPNVTLAQALKGVLKACGCSAPALPAPPSDSIDLNQAAQAQGYASSWDSQETSETATDELDDQVAAMALAVCDVYGEGDPLLITAQSASPTQDVGPGAGGNIGCYQQLPSEMGASLAQAPGAKGQTVDVSDPSVQAEAAVIELTDDLEAAHGDVQTAFADYIRDNHLAPYDGAWHGDGQYVPGQQATLAETQEGVGDWSEEIGVGDGQHIPTVPSADLLTEAYSQYAMWLESSNQMGIQAAPQGLDSATAGGVVYPPADQLSALSSASQQTGVPEALLIALTAHESGMSFNHDLVSEDLDPDGSPNSYGEFQMQPGTFTSAGREVGLPAAAFIPVADTRSGYDWGEPQGELDVGDEALAAAQFLKDQGVTASSDQHALEVAVWAYHNGPAAAVPTDPAALAADPDVQSVVLQLYPVYKAWVAAGEPAMGGSPPACASSKCDVGLYPAPGVFPWVPAGGFQQIYTRDRGQCTYWADFNFDPFPSGVGGGSQQNLGNGGDWYTSAVSQDLPTLPPSVLPPYGAAVSYSGFPGDQGYGHVAVVISDDPDGRGYWVSEMNVDGLGMVDVAHYPFPDPHLQGSILAPQAGGG